jgi:hypothetical protein
VTPEADAGATAARESRRDERIARLLLGLTAITFTAFCFEFVPRLTNVHFGDIEFTGWSGPLGSRILRGERPYVDFVLPIPPGSFLLLAGLEKLTGRFLLLQELGLNAALHLTMGFIAYAMARTVTSPKNAVFTAVASLGTIVQLNKECAYDHTAQVLAWGSVAAGMRALATENARGRRRAWVVAGALAGFTLAFKQSTALGAIVGWVLAFGYLAVLDVRRGGARRITLRLPELGRYAHGVALGLSGVWLMLIALGSTLRAFFQAVFVDASILKGGALFLVHNLTVYLLDYPSYAAPLGAIAVFVYIGQRLVRRHGTLDIADEHQRESRFRTWEIAVVGGLVLVTFGGGFAVLAAGVRPYPGWWIREIDRLKMLPPMTLVPLFGLFAAELVPSDPGRTPTGTFERPDAATILNAGVVAAFASTLMHNTSAPEFRPFYDNNAIIPLCFVSLFVVLDRADLRWLSAVLLALFLAAAGGNKFYRAMTANVPIGTNGAWAWMRLNDRGFTMAIAAARARQLAGPGGSVLVLPEDVQFVGLLHRPRPPILGAIVFVDQYAPRLVADDVRRLEEHPPKVIVVHPRRPSGWQRFFRIWSGASGAEALNDYVLYRLIPRRYERSSTFRTTFLYDPERLDIYVRRDAPPTPEQKERAQRLREETRSESLDGPFDDLEDEGKDEPPPPQGGSR